MAALVFGMATQQRGVGPRLFRDRLALASAGTCQAPHTTAMR